MSAYGESKACIEEAEECERAAAKLLESSGRDLELAAALLERARYWREEARKLTAQVGQDG